VELAARVERRRSRRRQRPIQQIARRLTRRSHQKRGVSEQVVHEQKISDAQLRVLRQQRTLWSGLWQPSAAPMRAFINAAVTSAPSTGQLTDELSVLPRPPQCRHHAATL
jgi:hypothetical protein